MSESVGTGYRGEGWLEEAEACSGEMPQKSEMILMEDELGIPNVDFRASETQKAWEYYQKLKAMIEERKRQSP